MTTPSGTRLSGLLLIVAGILFGSFMFFHPANNAQGALESIWVPVHTAWFFAYLLIICGLVPIYNQVTSQGKLVQVSYWLSLIGSILSLPISAWDSFIVPYLAKHTPDFIAQIEEISIETPVLVFRIIVFLTIFIFSLGFILFGITAVRLHWLPKFAGVCISLGAPLFWIGALFVSKGSIGNAVTIAGALLFGIGLVILGKNLLANSHQTSLSKSPSL